jgi:hypothetical protein
METLEHAECSLSREFDGSVVGYFEIQSSPLPDNRTLTYLMVPPSFLRSTS